MVRDSYIHLFIPAFIHSFIHSYRSVLIVRLCSVCISIPLNAERRLAYRKLWVSAIKFALFVECIMSSCGLAIRQLAQDVAFRVLHSQEFLHNVVVAVIHEHYVILFLMS